MYRASTDIQSYAIRKRSWEINLLNEFPYFTECMKINFMFNYNRYVRKPLIKKK